MKLLPASLLLLAATATIPAMCQSSTKSNLVIHWGCYGGLHNHGLSCGGFYYHGLGYGGQ